VTYFDPESSTPGTGTTVTLTGSPVFSASMAAEGLTTGELILPVSDYQQFIVCTPSDATHFTTKTIQLPSDLSGVHASLGTLNLQ